MAGLYIHIPFCSSRCIYCGFYSTTLLSLRQAYVDALCREMEMRRNYLSEPITTIYIGGGTPSQLSIPQLRQICETLERTYNLSSVEEFTIECNPDDVSEELAAALPSLGINRVSMGAQSFDDTRLRFLHRRHTSQQVTVAVERLRKAGIDNISIDLMFGFPGETISEWHKDIEATLELKPQHISAYSLQYEEGTPLYSMLSRNEVEEIDEELSRQMYADLIDKLTDAGYEHYEISNFALWKTNSHEGDSFRSRHNSSYWQAVPYIGLGAAAHSYDTISRQWNTADLKEYIRGVNEKNMVIERETLDDHTLYNEVVMTRLRTCEGISLNALDSYHRDYCLRQASKYISDGLLVLDSDNLEGNIQSLRLSREGIMVSNMVMSDLMLLLQDVVEQ